MRLTKKYKEDYFVNTDNRELTKLDIENDHNSSQIIRNKLGQLEDIEEKHGIDLVTLFKALENGAWLRKGYMGTCYIDGEPIFIEPQNLKLTLYPYYAECMEEENCSCGPFETALCLHDMNYEDVANIAKVKDYGKTWALTKEELE